MKKFKCATVIMLLALCPLISCQLDKAPDGYHYHQNDRNKDHASGHPPDIPPRAPNGRMTTVDGFTQVNESLLEFGYIEVISNSTTSYYVFSRQGNTNIRQGDSVSFNTTVYSLISTKTNKSVGISIMLATNLTKNICPTCQFNGVVTFSPQLNIPIIGLNWKLGFMDYLKKKAFFPGQKIDTLLISQAYGDLGGSDSLYYHQIEVELYEFNVRSHIKMQVAVDIDTTHKHKHPHSQFEEKR